MYRLQHYLLPFVFLALAACDSSSNDKEAGRDAEARDSIGMETDTIRPEYGGDDSIPGGEDVDGGTGEGHSPYSVLKMVELDAALTGYAVYVRGYIVGSANRSAISGADFGTGKAVKTNLLIADSPKEKDPKRCISIGLDTKTFREAMNLVDNPHRLGQAVTVFGTVKKYLYIIGIPKPISIENPD